MADTMTEGATDNQLLRELVEQWRKDVEQIPETVAGAYAATSIRACAAELEYLLDKGSLLHEDVEEIDNGR